MIEGRYQGELAADDEYVYSGTCTLDLSDGEFVLTFWRHTIYSISDGEIYLGTASETADSLALAARECHHIHSETTERKSVQPSDRRFQVRAVEDRLELMEPKRVRLVRWPAPSERLRPCAIDNSSSLSDLVSPFAVQRRLVARELASCGKDAIPLLLKWLDDEQRS